MKTPASGSPVSVTTTNFVPAATETLSYDPDGNLISDGQFVYAYDGENRLILVESRSGTPSALKRQIHYSYDGEGRLIRRYVNREMSFEYMPGATVTWWAVMESHRYLHGGWMCLAEYAPSGSDQLRLFVWGHDLSDTRGGAGGIGGLCMIHDSVKGPLFLGADRMGNIVHTVSGSTGTLVATTEYRSFGDVVEGPSGSMVPGFSSKLRDNTSGMNYLGYRWYGAKHGRWLNRDPRGERGGLNLSQAMWNAPLSYIDPLGLTSCSTISDVGNSEIESKLRAWPFGKGQPEDEWENTLKKGVEWAIKYGLKTLSGKIAGDLAEVAGQVNSLMRTFEADVYARYRCCICEGENSVKWSDWDTDWRLLKAQHRDWYRFPDDLATLLQDAEDADEAIKEDLQKLCREGNAE